MFNVDTENYKTEFKNSTKRFIRCNRNNRQSKLKRWEYCDEGQRPGAALREIKEDLKNKYIIFNDHPNVLWCLKDIQMHEFSNGTKSYWRAVPEWGSVYMDYSLYSALEEIQNGTYQKGSRAGGEEFDKKLFKLYDMLKNGVIIKSDNGYRDLVV